MAARPASRNARAQNGNAIEKFLIPVSRPACSPDGAKLNPGTVSLADGLIPDCASLHPGYDSRLLRRELAQHVLARGRQRSRVGRETLHDAATARRYAAANGA